MRYRRPVLLLAVLAVLIAACGGSEDAAAGGALGTAETDLGTILVDGAGKTLYGFTDDTGGVSTCYDTCASTWPPVSGGVAPGDELDAGAFTTVEREDGTTQLVAGTWPLYTFSGDTAPGDTNGQGSGDVWFMVAPDGSLIQGDSAAPGEATSEAQAVNNSLGQPVLADSQGLTLYYFSNDEPGTSTCNDPCSATWPPVAGDEQIATTGLDSGLLESITRDDGSEQLAYDGRPLYRYVDDVAPGDVNGHGVGDVWFAVAADGSEIGMNGVRLGSTDAGEVLIDPEGFTLYTFDNDDEGESVCNSPCSETWQPTPADVGIDASSVDEEQFEAITRDDGREQLSLNGRALYRFIDDANPGDANGQGIGNVWFTVPVEDVKAAVDDGGQDSEDDGGEGTDAGVTVAETELGPTLVDARGRTLYGFLNDSDGQSACYDDCATTWPAVSGDTAVDEPVVSAQISTIDRDDGDTQLVAGDWPLYTFSGDTEPGDVNGQGTGDVWFAVKPDGSLHR